MKSRRFETLGLLALAAAASPCAMAAEPHWYLGGNVGQSRSHFDEAAIARSLQGPALATTSISSDEHDLGYKLFVGYQFHRNFAVEGGYFDLGDFSFNTTTVPAGTLNGNLGVKGWNLDLVGILPIAERFSALGRLGVAHARTSSLFAGTGAVGVLANPSDSETNVKYGFGLQYDINYFISLRAEAERYRASNTVNGKDHVDLYSLGLVFRFAKAPAPPPRPVTPEPTPAPVVAPPPPAPKKAPPPPPEVVAPPPPPPPPVQQPAPRRDRN